MADVCFHWYFSFIHLFLIIHCHALKSTVTSAKRNGWVSKHLALSAFWLGPSDNSLDNGRPFCGTGLKWPGSGHERSRWSDPMGPLSPDGPESEWMAGEHVGGNKRPVATQLEPCLPFDAENRGVKVKVGAGRAGGTLPSYCISHLLASSKRTQTRSYVNS